jgi:restriction system protein
MQTVQADQGLLVSWGGFTRAVEAEARTRFFSVRLWNADDLIKAVLRNYEKLPEALRGELPLKRMWALVLEE